MPAPPEFHNFCASRFQTSGEDGGQGKKFPTFDPMKILMVCLGNICRSPLAEGVLKHKAAKAGLQWQLDSAGINNGYHVGESPHALSQKVAKLHGLDISDQKARAFETVDFERYDKIYAMSEDILQSLRTMAGKKFDSSKTDLLMNELYPGRNISIPDPWYGTEPGYHQVFDMIDQATDRIIQKYGHWNHSNDT
jgi:protein-tyrosine phosphatase